MPQKEYFASLDSLRFLAFLCVFVSHMFVFFGYVPGAHVSQVVIGTFLTQGNIGVNFFFVLSGFLITYLLLREKEGEAAGKGVNIKNFYVRRVLRIWPVYFAVVAIGFFIIPLLTHVAAHFGVQASYLLEGTELYRLPWFVFFLANFESIVHATLPSFVLAVLWSISVEEQFYAVWPWVIARVRLVRLPWVFAALAAISVASRVYYGHDLPVLRSSTLSFVSDLVAGSLLAYFAIYSPRVRQWFAALPMPAIAATAVGVLGLLMANRILEANLASSAAAFLYALVPLAFDALFCIVIGFYCFSGKAVFPARLEAWTRYLGQRSYGLYCYHCIAILFVKLLFFAGIFSFASGAGISFVIQVALSFAATIAIAAVSYIYMEKPALALKARYQAFLP